MLIPVVLLRALAKQDVEYGEDAILESGHFVRAPEKGTLLRQSAITEVDSRKRCDPHPFFFFFFFFF